MKILILFGSPKTNGSTAKLTGAFIIRKNVDGMHLDVIVSYGRKPFDTISITEVPFFTGKHCNRPRAMPADIVRRQTVALKKTLKSLWQSSKTPMR